MVQRRSIRHVGLSALAGALVWTAAADAQAFCRTTTCDVNNKAEQCHIDENGCNRSGAPLSYRSLPIVYRFYSKGSAKLETDAARAAVRSAFKRWSSVRCGTANHKTSLELEEDAAIGPRKPANPHLPGAEHFGIYFRDDAWTAKDADSTLALTTQKYTKNTGYVDESDIEINTTTGNWATADSAKGVDLEAVLTHEVGHYIGLAHSKDPSSIMVPSYCQSAERCGAGKQDARELSMDDEAAVCALFPPSGPSGVLYEEPDSGACAVSSSGPSRSATWLPLAAAALALIAACRRLRASRAS